MLTSRSLPWLLLPLLSLLSQHLARCSEHHQVSGGPFVTHRIRRNPEPRPDEEGEGEQNRSSGQLRKEPYQPLVISGNLTIEQIAHLLLRRYDNHHRPSFSGSPTTVEINMYVQSFGSINVIDMDYSIDILLRQKWTDPRLSFTGYSHTLSLSYLKERIWIPDLFFRNSKFGFLHEITTPNYLIWLQSDGTITFSQKLTIRLSCPMQLWNFPMDAQVCPLEIGSYGFALEDLEFVWMRNKTAVTLNQQMVLNEFEQPKLKTGKCEKAYKATGQFTCLFVEFYLVRKFGFYLIYTYLPSILIVAISWISFWIDYRAVPARITLGLLSVLALMTQSSATVQKLPRVSYIKAIDVWLFACLAFVVASLLEFALVNMIARRQEQRRARDDLRNMMRKEMRMLRGNLVAKKRPSQTPESNAKSSANATTNNIEDVDDSKIPLQQQQQQQQVDDNGGFEAGKVDNFFVFVYPACFMLFNIVYWVTYMCSRRSHQGD